MRERGRSERHGVDLRAQQRRGARHEKPREGVGAPWSRALMGEVTAWLEVGQSALFSVDQAAEGRILAFVF